MRRANIPPLHPLACPQYEGPGFSGAATVNICAVSLCSNGLLGAARGPVHEAPGKHAVVDPALSHLHFAEAPLFPLPLTPHHDLDPCPPFKSP